MYRNNQVCFSNYLLFTLRDKQWHIDPSVLTVYAMFFDATTLSDTKVDQKEAS